MMYQVFHDCQEHTHTHTLQRMNMHLILIQLAQVENIRELALSLVLDFVKAVPDVTPTLPYLVPAIESRMGQPEIEEDSEEVSSPPFYSSLDLTEHSILFVRLVCVCVCVCVCVAHVLHVICH